MTDVRDFTPLYGSQTLAAVRARMDADANAGLTPDDPAWIDTREGTFYWDVTQVCALECARLWDALGSETVAAAFPSAAWGDYLDEHAQTFGLLRNPAVEATGYATFIGDPDVFVSEGTQVAAPPSDPSTDAIEFQTTASGTTGAQLLAPAGLTATPSTAAGVLPAGTWLYHVTAYNAFGETLRGAEVSATLTAAGEVALAWDAVTGAAGYRVYRTTVLGALGERIADTAALTLTDGGTAVPGAIEPAANTTAGVTLHVVAMEAGGSGNLGADAITDLDTLVAGITLVRNDAPTDGGTDPETDESLQGRILAQYEGSGAGSAAWYVQQALDQPGVQRATCIAVWNGPGTVLVIPMLIDGSPVSTDTVAALQALLDPTTGQAHGIAPVGADVTVATTAALDVNVTSGVNFEDGYSLDGTTGTVATRSLIVAALNSYLISLNPGDVMSYQRIQAAIVGVGGVLSTTGLTVNGGTADITLAANPPEYPLLMTPALS